MQTHRAVECGWLLASPCGDIGTSYPREILDESWAGDVAHRPQHQRKVLSMLNSSTADFLCHFNFSIISIYSILFHFPSLQSLAALSAGVIGAVHLEEVRNKIFLGRIFPLKKDRMFQLSITAVPFSPEWIIRHKLAAASVCCSAQPRHHSWCPDKERAWPEDWI